MRMKRQKPPSGLALATIAGRALQAAAPDAAKSLAAAFLERMPAMLVPGAAPARSGLEPVSRAELRETGEDAIAEYVRRAFFHLPREEPPETKKFAVAKRASGARARESGGSVAAVRDAATTRMDRGMAVYRERSSGLLQLLHHEILLQFAPDVGIAERRAFLALHALVPKYSARIGAAQIVVHPRDPDCRGDALLALADHLNADPERVAAAPDFVSQFTRSATRRAAGAPSAAQWHLGLIGAPDAWALTRGSDAITIAILDDGVDIDHPELAPNIHRHPVPGDRRDRCGRDFTPRKRGDDPYDPRPKAFDDSDNDVRWNDIHGTACAGVAAGTGPHAYGIAPGCRLLPVKIFRACPRHRDHNGDLAMAKDSDVAAAIRYAALTAHADVLCCAWAGPDGLARALAPALRDARRDGRKGKGAIVVCATGNDTKTRIAYPARDDNAFAVGASTDADTLARYSNTGPELCVVAPSDGGRRGIVTTDVSMPGRGYNPGDDASGDDGLFCDTFGGTSSATALVAGLCGLLLSLKPAMTPDDVRAVLTSTARKIGPASAYKTNGHSNRYGYGRIDAAKAVAAALAWMPVVQAPPKKSAAKKTTAKKSAAKRPASSKKR